MSKIELVIITYEDCVVSIRTSDPEKEIREAMLRGGVLSIIKDNQIIYSKKLQ